MCSSDLVEIEIKNIDTYQVAVDTLEGRGLYELVDGGMDKLLDQALDGRPPKMSVPVYFELKKTNGKWIITDIDSEDDMVRGISGNMDKVIEEAEGSETMDTYYDDIESDLLN